MAQKKSAQEIADEIAGAMRRLFEAFGREWEGDVFYSDIHLRTKGLPASVYLEVCRLLEAKGFYVHS